MSAIGFGLLAAVLWGVSAVVGTRLVRVVGAWSALATTMPIGLALVAPFLLAADRPSVPATAWIYAASVGLCYVAAMTCWLLAVRSGKVGLVTPIVSADGATAAVIAVAAYGEALRAGVAGALGIVVAGVVLVGIRRDAGPHGHFTGRELGLALAAAGFFGFAFVAGGQAEDDLGVAWTLVTSRLTAVVLIAPIVLVRGGVKLPRTGIPFAVGMAGLDLAGFAAFLTGAGRSVAITSVLASQYAVVSVIGGYVAFGERLTRLQSVGIGVTLVGVAALAVLRG
jgi:transporter family protein